MPLNLYRRHRPRCEGRHAEDTYSGEAEERRKGWKSCTCGIHISGTLGGRFGRKATGTADWAEARAFATGLEQVGAWTASAPPSSLPLTGAPHAPDGSGMFPPAGGAVVAPPTASGAPRVTSLLRPSPTSAPAAPGVAGSPSGMPASPAQLAPPRVFATPSPAAPSPLTVARALAHPTPDSRPRVALEDAFQVFLTHRTAASLKRSTMSKYRTVVQRIRRYAAERGYVLVDQFTPIDIDMLWAAWHVGPRTRAQRLVMLRAFFRFCAHRKWIAESPVSPDIKPPVGANRPANKAPFTDDEVQRILRACDQLHVVFANQGGIDEWTGEDLKDFVWLLLHTGYRISDATFFDLTKLHDNQVFIRATKNGGDVFAYLPDWLCERLRAHAARRGRAQPFLVGSSRRLETVTHTWRRRLEKAFQLAGPFDERPTPHRFRHTFARILLQRGVTVTDVADLMGDDEKTVREHYARWVPERQSRLTRILKEAFVGSPTA